MKIRDAAWWSFHETEPWEIGATACAEWCAEQDVEHGEQAGVVTHALNDLGVRVLDRLRWRTSPRASRDRIPRGDLSVLCYVPDWRLLAFAQRTARNGSVAVVQSPPEQIEGWARWHGALDLRTETRAEPLPDDFREQIDRLLFYGNNAYAPKYDRQRAVAIFSDIDPTQQHLVWGALIAAGVRASGVERLQKATSSR